MSPADLIKSTLDYAALTYAPPPFALVNGEARRAEGYVVVVRTSVENVRPFDVHMGPDVPGGWVGGMRKLHSGMAIVTPCAITQHHTASTLHVTTLRAVLSRESAEALFADVCADLRRGGATMRQWSEARPFQVIVARTTLDELHRRVPEWMPEWMPVLYASGPRWIPTKESPSNEPPL